MYRWVCLLLVATGWGVVQGDCPQMANRGVQARYLVYGQPGPDWLSVMRDRNVLDGMSLHADAISMNVALGNVSPASLQCRHLAMPALMARLLEEPGRAEAILAGAGYEKQASAGFVLGCRASAYRNRQGMSLVWLEDVGVPARMVRVDGRIWQLADLESRVGERWLANGVSALNREEQLVPRLLARADEG